MNFFWKRTFEEGKTVLINGVSGHFYKTKYIKTKTRNTKSKDRRCGDRYETINHKNEIEVTSEVVENDNCVGNIIVRSGQAYRIWTYMNDMYKSHNLS